MGYKGLKRCGRYYYIVRPNAKIEKWADENLVRVKGSLKWIDKKIDTMSNDIVSKNEPVIEDNITIQEDPAESSFDKF